MTALARKIRRSVRTPARDLVIELHPGDGTAYIRLREKHRREGYSITLASLYVRLAALAAEQGRDERRAARRLRA